MCSSDLVLMMAVGVGSATGPSQPGRQKDRIRAACSVQVCVCGGSVCACHEVGRGRWLISEEEMSYCSAQCAHIEICALHDVIEEMNKNRKKSHRVAGALAWMNAMAGSKRGVVGEE